MIDRHVRTRNKMDGSNFEHSVDCPNSFRYPLDVVFYLPYWGISPYFINKMIWLHWKLLGGSYLIRGSPLH